MLAQFVAVGIGAAIGAWLRWGLTLWLNAKIAGFPAGTLAANLIGGYLVGIAVAFFAVRADLPEVWRLLAITGLLGGLTTFSTFSAEVTSLLLRGHHVDALLLAFAHLAGSVLLTIAGLATFQLATR